MQTTHEHHFRPVHVWRDDDGVLCVEVACAGCGITDAHAIDDEDDPEYGDWLAEQYRDGPPPARPSGPEPTFEELCGAR